MKTIKLYLNRNVRGVSDSSFIVLRASKGGEIPSNGISDFKGILEELFKDVKIDDQPADFKYDERSGGCAVSFKNAELMLRHIFTQTALDTICKLLSKVAGKQPSKANERAIAFAGRINILLKQPLILENFAALVGEGMTVKKLEKMARIPIVINSAINQFDDVEQRIKIATEISKIKEDELDKDSINKAFETVMSSENKTESEYEYEEYNNESGDEEYSYSEEEQGRKQAFLIPAKQSTKELNLDSDSDFDSDSNGNHSVPLPQKKKKERKKRNNIAEISKLKEEELSEFVEKRFNKINEEETGEEDNIEFGEQNEENPGFIFNLGKKSTASLNSEKEEIGDSISKYNSNSSTQEQNETKESKGEKLTRISSSLMSDIIDSIIGPKKPKNSDPSSSTTGSNNEGENKKESEYEYEEYNNESGDEEYSYSEEENDTLSKTEAVIGTIPLTTEQIKDLNKMKKAKTIVKGEKRSYAKKLIAFGSDLDSDSDSDSDSNGNHSVPLPQKKKKERKKRNKSKISTGTESDSNDLGTSESYTQDINPATEKKTKGLEKNAGKTREPREADTEDSGTEVSVRQNQDEAQFSTRMSNTGIGQEQLSSTLNGRVAIDFGSNNETSDNSSNQNQSRVDGNREDKRNQSFVSQLTNRPSRAANDGQTSSTPLIAKPKMFSLEELESFSNEVRAIFEDNDQYPKQFMKIAEAVSICKEKEEEEDEAFKKAVVEAKPDRALHTHELYKAVINGKDENKDKEFIKAAQDICENMYQENKITIPKEHERDGEYKDAQLKCVEKEIEARTDRVYGGEGKLVFEDTKVEIIKDPLTKNFVLTGNSDLFSGEGEIVFKNLPIEFSLNVIVDDVRENGFKEVMKKIALKTNPYGELGPDNLEISNGSKIVIMPKVVETNPRIVGFIDNNNESTRLLDSFFEKSRNVSKEGIEEEKKGRGRQ